MSVRYSTGYRLHLLYSVQTEGYIWNTMHRLNPTSLQTCKKSFFYTTKVASKINLPETSVWITRKIAKILANLFKNHKKIIIWKNFSRNYWKSAYLPHYIFFTFVFKDFTWERQNLTQPFVAQLYVFAPLRLWNSVQTKEFDYTSETLVHHTGYI